MDKQFNKELTEKIKDILKDGKDISKKLIALDYFVSGEFLGPIGNISEVLAFVEILDKIEDCNRALSKAFHILESIEFNLREFEK